MKRLLVLVVLLVLAVGVLAGEAAAAPPANDDFANATVLTSLPASVSESTVEATKEGGEPASCCGGSAIEATVWFAYTPAANGRLVADTVGSDFDTIIAVYTGSWGSLVEVDCNDDMGLGVPQSRLPFDAYAGTTYYFQVGGYYQSGSLVFNLDQPVVPANDDFVDATVLSSLPASVSEETYLATTECEEPTPSCAYDLEYGRSVWFAYSPAAVEGLVADTVGSDFDTVLAVYTGSLGSLSEVACNDDIVYEEDLWSQVQFQAAAGITYYFQVAGWDGDAGNLTFNLESTGMPPTPGLGRIVVNEVTSPAGSLQAFVFHPSWGADFTLADGGSHDSGELPPGFYSVAESVPAGWQVSATCSDGSDPGAIGLASGETVTCTFTNRWPTCFGQPATIVGTAGADMLVGTPGRDVIVGLGGNDVIRGLGGNDRICGGAGADIIYGGAGRDRLRGGLGRDTLFGGFGDDRLRGGIGVDWADGGLGVDSCWAETTVACP